MHRMLGGNDKMKVYIVVDSKRCGKEAIQAVFTNQIRALKYVEKWKAIGLQGLGAYVFEPEGRK